MIETVVVWPRKLQGSWPRLCGSDSLACGQMNQEVILNYAGSSVLWVECYLKIAWPTTETLEGEVSEDGRKHSRGPATPYHARGRPFE
jgi:hypothetical protein